jgi:glycosyltransferase involved in cell wall biosynthesis
MINYFHTFIIPAFECWNIIKKERIDLIHLNNTLLRPQQWILASIFTNAQIIAHERGINKWFPFQTKFWARYLKSIICISNAVKNNLLNHGFPEKKLVMIYNGLDPKEFSCTKTKKETLKTICVETDYPVVGIVGNIKAWKGQETVIKSIKLVKRKYKNIKCLIVGGVSERNNDYLQYLEGVTEREGLKKNIIFTGKRKDIPDLINTMDILIHASTDPEPFGRVLLEGMALSKPVISTNIGASPEIVVDGETGILVPPGNEKKLFEAINYLLKNKRVALEMGDAGKERVINYFHITKYLEKTQELYAKIFSELN